MIAGRGLVDVCREDTDVVPAELGVAGLVTDFGVDFGVVHFSITWVGVAFFGDGLAGLVLLATVIEAGVFML